MMFADNIVLVGEILELIVNNRLDEWRLALEGKGLKIQMRLKGKSYKSVVKSTMIYGSECWAVDRRIEQSTLGLTGI
jgi:hypothetical protein